MQTEGFKRILQSAHNETVFPMHEQDLIRKEARTLLGRLPGSCGCGTHSPALSDHGENCGYREIGKRLLKIESLLAQSP